jgi:predicted dehydrogenase
MTMSDVSTPLWLVGTGPMAQEYAKVLLSLRVPFVAIGRGRSNCEAFREKTGVEAVAGGLDAFLAGTDATATHALVAVGIEALAGTTETLLRRGVRRLLVEKPGVAYPNEIGRLCEVASEHRGKVCIAYNRRFYASVRRVRELIREEGGVRSMHFEFTEWSHMIAELKKHPAEHNNWFLGNSTHVIDTAFFLAGEPVDLCAYHTGGIPWHPTSSVFTGAGRTGNGALFSYHANWEGPGRWGLEIITPRNRYILRPMESLQVQRIGSVAIEPVEIDDALDKSYKPGLYLQAKAFLDAEFDDFAGLEDQRRLIETFYNRMSGYGGK